MQLAAVAGDAAICRHHAQMVCSRMQCKSPPAGALLGSILLSGSRINLPLRLLYSESLLEADDRCVS